MSCWFVELPDQHGEPVLINMANVVEISRASPHHSGEDVDARRTQCVLTFVTREWSLVRLGYDDLCERLRLNPADRLPPGHVVAAS